MKVHLNVCLAAVTAVVGLVSLPASANLVLQGSDPIGGTGLGTVSTVLTLQSPGSSTTESGSVAWNGSSDVTFGDTQALNSTYTLGSVGITDASQIGIVFNAAEPRNASQVNLAALNLSVYSPTGGTLFNSLDVICPGNATCDLTNTFSGIGNSGFLFQLDATQSAAVNSVIAANAVSGAFGDFRIGLNATVNNATGGPETFFITRVGEVAPAIPEPETYALMMAGLGVLGFVAKRRRSL